MTVPSSNIRPANAHLQGVVLKPQRHVRCIKVDLHRKEAPLPPRALWLLSSRQRFA